MDYPTEAFDNVPVVAITLGRESAWLTRFDGRGVPSAAYPVAAKDVASAFSPFGADTGLLPPGTLFWQKKGGQARIGVYAEPAARTLRFDPGGREVSLRAPLPGLVFVGKGTRYQVYAVKARPARETDLLYKSPLPNVYDDGAICAGSVTFPKCGPATIWAAFETFFESLFNYDLQGGRIAPSGDDGREGVVEILRGLKRKAEFPLDRLLPQGHPATMRELIRGER